MMNEMPIQHGFDETDAPEGFLAKPRGDQFCYECAFHTGADHNFNDCLNAVGRSCIPSCREDKLWVVFVALPDES